MTGPIANLRLSWFNSVRGRGIQLHATQHHNASNERSRAQCEGYVSERGLGQHGKSLCNAARAEETEMRLQCCVMSK